MPDWVLTVPRLLWAPVGWLLRKMERRGVDKRALVSEGSDAVTPVIQVVKTSIGPLSIMWGTNEENAERLKATHAEWHQKLRGPLMAYGNQHPSDEVRASVHEYEVAVNRALGDTVWLLSHRSPSTPPTPTRPRRTRTTTP